MLSSAPLWVYDVCNLLCSILPISVCLVPPSSHVQPHLCSFASRSVTPPPPQGPPVRHCVFSCAATCVHISKTTSCSLRAPKPGLVDNPPARLNGPQDVIGRQGLH